MQNLGSTVADAIDKLQQNLRQIVVPCRACGGQLEVCPDSTYSVTLVSFLFIREVQMPKHAKCTSCNADKVEVNPVWVNYFPASPQKQVRRLYAAVA